MRSLDPEEKALWEQVASTIRPLSRQPLKASAEETAPPPRPGPAPKPAAGRTQAVSVSHKTKDHSRATLDSHWDRRLRSGAAEPDRILDLHGMTLGQAWRAIDSTLERAIAQQARLVLLITGHARPGAPPVQRGKIRAAVQDWLAASRHSAAIAAVRGAHRRHGGGGSLYIILRRKPPRSTLS